MAKLTYEEKKEIVRLYFVGHSGTERWSKECVYKSNIAKIVKDYEFHGEKSLKKRKNIQ